MVCLGEQAGPGDQFLCVPLPLHDMTDICVPISLEIVFLPFEALEPDPSSLARMAHQPQMPGVPVGLIFFFFFF